MPEICDTCLQPILPGERSDAFQGLVYHEDPGDCVRAVVLRCSQIAKGHDALGSGAQAIEREFAAVLEPKNAEVACG